MMNIDILHGIYDRILDGGSATTRPAVLVYGMELDLSLTLYKEVDGVPVAYTQDELEQYASWQFAADDDFDFSSTSAVLTSTGFTVAGNILSFVADTNTTQFGALPFNAITGYVDGGAEIKGYKAGETLPSIVLLFPVRFQKTRTDETATPPTELQPDFVTAAQAESIAAGKMDSYYPTTEQGTLADADRVPWFASAASLVRKYVTWSSLKAEMLSYLDGVRGLLSSAQKAALTGGPETDADAQHTHPNLAGQTTDLSEVEAAILALAEADVLYSPTGTVVAGTIYRQGVGAWVVADPDDLLCETYELFVALGTDVATSGMARKRTVAGAPSGANGAILWLADGGGQTDTVPTSATHAGRVARAVGYVRDSETWEFDGHLPGAAFTEAAS